MTAHRHVAAAAAFLALCTSAATVAPTVGTAASSADTVVTASVTAATSVDADGCLPGILDRTEFGVLPAGSSDVTGSPCTVVFGSNGPSTQLRVHQRDGWGDAMHGRPDGSLDVTFDDDGYLGNGDDRVHVAAHADGHFIRMYDGSNQAINIIRYDEAGGSDDAFAGGTGVLNWSVPGMTNTRQHDMIVDRAGRIVFASEEMNAPLRSSLCRITAAGAPDLGFSSDGCLDLDADIGELDRATGVIEAPSDGYFLVGAHTVAAGSLAAWVARVDDDGNLVTSWGSSGFWYQPSSSDTAVFPSVTLQSTGRLVVASTVLNVDHDVALFAIDPDTGTTDTTFGTSGAFEHDAADDNAVAIHADADDHLVVLSVDPDSDAPIAITRVLGDGSAVDPAFNGGATRFSTLVRGRPTYERATMSLDADGGIRAVFAAQVGASRYPGVVVLDQDGTIDETFSGDGETVLSNAGTAPTVRSHASMPDGRILVSGGGDLYMLDAPTVPQFDDAGGDDWSTPGAGFFAACLVGSSQTDAGPGVWAVDTNDGADCADGDADPWMAIGRYAGDPTPGVETTLATTSTTGPAAASVSLLFGLRVAGSQQQGRYMAPISFVAVAP